MVWSLNYDFCYPVRIFDPDDESIGWLHDYDPDTRLATWFVPSKIMRKIMSKKQNQKDWKGFLSVRSTVFRLLPWKLQHGDLVEVENWVNDIEGRDASIYADQQNVEEKENVEFLKEQTHIQIVGHNSSETAALSEHARLQSSTAESQQIHSIIEFITQVHSRPVKELEPEDFERIFGLDAFSYKDCTYEVLHYNNLGFNPNLHDATLKRPNYTLSSDDIIQILAENDFQLLNFGDIMRFCREINAIDVPVVRDKVFKSRRRYTFHQPGSAAYQEVQHRINIIKKGYRKNRMILSYILSTIVGSPFIKRSYDFQIRNKRRQAVNGKSKQLIVFMPSGSGKTTLYNNYPNVFFEQDQLIKDVELKDYFESVENAQKNNDWQILNNWWRDKINKNRDKFEGKILLCGHPNHIPADLYTNSESFILLPSDYRDIRFFDLALKSLYCLDKDILVADRNLYLLHILVYFRIDLILYKKNFCKKWTTITE